EATRESGGQPVRLAQGAAGAGADQDKQTATGRGGDGQVAEMTVEDTRLKPFSDGNVDIPRTIDDAQPYYIFDSKTIEQSGATNIEDFLKQRLTMNTVAQTNGQIAGANQAGNTSSLNLRGVGTNETL